MTIRLKFIGLLCLGATLIAARAAEQAIPDSLLDIKKARNILFQDPDLALQITNQLEKQGRTPAYQIAWVRAQCYGRMQKQRIAVAYAKQVLASDSVKNNPTRFINMCRNIIPALISTRNYDEAMKYCQRMGDMAERVTDKPEYKSEVFSTLARIHWLIGDKEKAFEQMEESIRLTDQLIADLEREEKPLIATLTKQFRCYESLGNWLSDSNEPAKALEAAQKLLPILQQLEKRIGNTQPREIPEPLYQYYDYVAHCTLATRYAQTGNKAEEERYAARLANHPAAGNIDNRQLLANYYETSGQWQKAIETWLPFASYIYDGDSINAYRENACRGLSYAYKQAGQYRLASEMASKALLLQDSLTRRAEESDALEIATLQETHEMEQEVERQQATTRLQRIYLEILAIVLLSICAIAFLIYRNLRTTRIKNRAMAKQIDGFLLQSEELEGTRKELERLKAEAALATKAVPLPKEEATVTASEQEQPDKERELFNRIRETLLKNDLFLDPELSRDILVRQTSINKNKMAQLIQQYAGTNFNGFVNNLRLEHSLRLLKDKQNYTIQAVANDSGFNNVRTFYRLFRERFGMTPMEYRNAL